MHHWDSSIFSLSVSCHCITILINGYRNKLRSGDIPIKSACQEEVELMKTKYAHQNGHKILKYEKYLINIFIL